MEYNKLVRDRIPEIIEGQSETQGHSVNELMTVYEKKHIERGGFSKRILLLEKE